MTETGQSTPSAGLGWAEPGRSQSFSWNRRQYYLHFMTRSSVLVQTSVSLVPSRESPLRSPENVVTSESWHGASVLP